MHYDAIQIGDLVILKEDISPSYETTNTREYDYQKEFRIAIDTKENVDKPYWLDIGDIRDIAIVTSIDEINSSLQSNRDRLN